MALICLCRSDHLPINEQPIATQSKESNVTMVTEGDSGGSDTVGDREEVISEPASDPPAGSEEHSQGHKEEVCTITWVEGVAEFHRHFQQ